jgi:hypothetical protein
MRPSSCGMNADAWLDLRRDRKEERDDTMPHIGTRGRGLGTIALAVLATALGLWLAWAQRSTDRASRGRIAYERGEWEAAAGLARGSR